MSSHFNPYAALAAITFPFERCELCVVRIIDCIKGVDYAAADAQEPNILSCVFGPAQAHRAHQIQILFNPHSDFQLCVCSAPAQINIYACSAAPPLCNSQMNGKRKVLRLHIASVLFIIVHRAAQQ
jgi:hypothetical protein